MRVAADELLRDGAEAFVHGKIAVLLVNARVEEDVEEKVAELLLDVGRLALRYSVNRLEAFLNHVAAQGKRRLRFVPRASVLAAEGADNGKKILEPAHFFSASTIFRFDHDWRMRFWFSSVERRNFASISFVCENSCARIIRSSGVKFEST